MKVSTLRRQLHTELTASPFGDFAADCMIKEVTGFSQAELLLGEAEISPLQEAKCRRFASRFAEGEPLQYLLGEWEFFGIPFSVGSGVLIPRADSEILCERAALELPLNATIADLCAGSACLGIAVANVRPDLTVYLVERSKAAMKYLKENQQRYSELSLFPILGDVTEQNTIEKIPQLDGILCNPPYLTAAEMKMIPREVSYEPEEALFGGVDGLEFYRVLPTLWREKLKEGGRVYFEIGMTQKDSVCQLFQSQGYQICDVLLDIEDRPRVVVAEKRGNERWQRKAQENRNFK